MSYSTLLFTLLFGILILVVLALVLVLVSRENTMFSKDTVWIALGTISTFLVVLVALFGPKFQDWINRPILKVSLYRGDTPPLRLVESAKVAFLTLQIENVGKDIALNAQPFITNAGSLQGKGPVQTWSLTENWIPVPLYWVTGQFVVPAKDARNITFRCALPPDAKEGKPSPYVVASTAGEQPVGEKTLIAKRPYYFDVGRFGAEDHSSFILTWSDIYRNIPEKYSNNQEHCFEITVYAHGIDPMVKYVTLEWKGEFVPEKNKVMEQPNAVRISDSPPWRRRR